MRGQLSITSGKGIGEVVVLPARGAFVIGRSPDCDLCIDDSLVSRRHCQIDCDGDLFWVSDLGSKSGTMLNDAPVHKALLYDGDDIRLGNTLLVFARVDGSPEAEGAPAEMIAAIGQELAKPTRGLSRNQLDGEVLAGCEIKRQLDANGTATVYEAVQVSMQRPVVVKVLSARPANGGDAGGQSDVERFLHGARLAGRLSHSNVVTVFDAGVAAGMAFVVSEYVDGRSLRDVLGSQARKRARLPLSTALAVCSHVVRALEHAHKKGVVHGNIKPRNVLVDRDGTAKLGGWEFAHSTEDEPARSSRILEAVHSYLSPEQCEAGGEGDPRSDIYSLGAVLFHALANRPPFDAATPEAMVAEILRGGVSWRSDAEWAPSRVREICDKAMCRDVAGRYQSAAELHHALRAARRSLKNGGEED